MKIDLFINGEKYLNQVDTFSESFLKNIDQSISFNQNPELHQTKASAITILTEICKKDNLVHLMDKHITLDLDFANALRLFDTVHCSCLKPKTELGEVIRELMIDNYELVLTGRTWMETNHLSLSFEALDYGEANFFLSDMITGKN